MCPLLSPSGQDPALWSLGLTAWQCPLCQLPECPHRQGPAPGTSSLGLFKYHCFVPSWVHCAVGRAGISVGWVSGGGLRGPGWVCAKRTHQALMWWPQACPPSSTAPHGSDVTLQKVLERTRPACLHYPPFNERQHLLYIL